MTETEPDLKAALQLAQHSEMQFAFLQKGNESVLLLAKRLPPTEIKAAREKLKPTAVIKGRTLPEHGQLVFTVKKAMAGMEVQLKRTLMKAANYSRPFEVREIADMEEEADSHEGHPEPAGEGSAEPQSKPATASGTATVPTPPAPPPIEDFQFKQRLQKLMPGYNRAHQAGGPAVGALELAMKLAAAAAHSHDYAQANLQLDKVDAELARVLPALDAATRDAAALKSQVFLRLNALSEDYKKAVHGPDAERLHTLFTTVKGLADNHDYAQASKVLDELEGLLKQPTAHEGEPAGRADVLKRLAAVAEDYKKALASHHPEESRLKTLFGAVKGLADNHDYVQAGKVLDELDAVLHRGGSGATAPAAPESKPHTDGKAAAGKGAPAEKGAFVIYTQSRLVWDATRKKVQMELQALEKAIVAACEKNNQVEDADFEVDMGALASQTKELYRVLEKLDTRLIDKLDEALNASGEVREARQKEAAGIVKEYLDFVNSDPLMSIIDENGFTPSRLHAEVTAALKGLASKL